MLPVDFVFHVINAASNSAVDVTATDWMFALGVVIVGLLSVFWPVIIIAAFIYAVAKMSK